MNRTKHATAVVTLLLAAFTLAACSSSNPAPDPPSASTAAPSSATSAPSTPEGIAQAQVLSMLPAYFRTIDELYNDPKKSADDIYSVATDPEAGQEIRAIAQTQRAGIRSSGYTKLVASNVISVDLQYAPGAKPRVLPTVKVTACVDVSDDQATYKSGKSAIAPGRKRYLISQLTVVNPKPSSFKSWVVSDAPNRQADSCGA